MKEGLDSVEHISFNNLPIQLIKESKEYIKGGALWGPNWKTMSSISRSVIGMFRSRHWLWESFGISTFWSSFRIKPTSIWSISSKEALKWLTNLFSTSIGSSKRVPSSFLICTILLLAFLCLTIVWKYLVLLSPNKTQLFLAFCAYIISSLFKSPSSSFLKVFCFLTSSVEVIESWIP